MNANGRTFFCFKKNKFLVVESPGDLVNGHILNTHERARGFETLLLDKASSMMVEDRINEGARAWVRWVFDCTRSCN